MDDLNLSRVHFRMPVSGVGLLEDVANKRYVSGAALARQMVMAWYDEPFSLKVFNERPKTQATVQLPEHVVAEIATLCEERGITRSALLRNVIMTSLTNEEKGD